MRGSRAKSLRKHVAERYKFLSVTPIYRRKATGPIVLAQQCQRALYQHMKREYKKLMKTGVSMA